jgi:hypothetical protein
MARPIWFRADTTGLAAYPVTWQGYVLIALYLAGLIAAAVILLPRMGQGNMSPLWWFLAITAFLTVALVAIALATTARR